jgi:hypothetical protein
VATEQVTTRLPVRSALFKQRTGGLVVRWVTTGESPLLNVFFVLAGKRIYICLRRTALSGHLLAFCDHFGLLPNIDETATKAFG